MRTRYRLAAFSAGQRASLLGALGRLEVVFVVILLVVGPGVVVALLILLHKR